MVAMAHPMLAQGSAPAGEHQPYGGDVFPRIDQDGVCWAPEGYHPDHQDEGDDWSWYENPQSEVIRKECAQLPIFEECNVALTWMQVDCENPFPEASADSEAAEDETFGLPLLIVLPV